MGLITAYLSSSILTTCALLRVKLFVEYIILSSSLNTVSNMLGLSISNSLGVLCEKLYLCSNGFSLDILSIWREIL